MKTAALIFGLLCAAAAAAQDWPTKPVRIIVPFAPGGTADIAGRVMAAELSKAFPQTFIVGQLQMTIDNVPTVLGHVRAGKLVALGVTTAAPLAALPEVPPIARSVPGYETVAFFALMAPAATPPRVIERLAAETGRAL